MNLHILRIFGSVFLIAALIGFSTMFGHWESSSPAKPSLSTTILLKKNPSTMPFFLKNGPMSSDSDLKVPDYIYEGRDHDEREDIFSGPPADITDWADCGSGYRC